MTMGENRLSWVVPALAVTIIAATVAAFSGPVVRLILEPLAWLLWAGWRLLASVDQEIWWVILSLVCAVPVIRLFDAQLRSQDVGHSGNTAEPDPGARVTHWMDRAAGMRRGDGGREALRADLESLAASVAETTKMRLPPELARDQGGALLRRLPGFRRRADEQAIEGLLNWMEVAMEIRDDEHAR
jgi:hypothetical protein